jgi:hypothetical protein
VVTRIHIGGNKDSEELFRGIIIQRNYKFGVWSRQSIGYMLKGAWAWACVYVAWLCAY